MPTAELELSLLGLTDEIAASSVEDRLNETPGVVDATVNLIRAGDCELSPGVATREDLVAAVRKAGYDVVSWLAEKRLSMRKRPHATLKSPISGSG